VVEQVLPCAHREQPLDRRLRRPLNEAAEVGG
jgi:hypothetical protein